MLRFNSSKLTGAVTRIPHLQNEKKTDRKIKSILATNQIECEIASRHRQIYLDTNSK